VVYLPDHVGDVDSRCASLGVDVVHVHQLVNKGHDLVVIRWVLQRLAHCLFRNNADQQVRHCYSSQCNGEQEHQVDTPV
jgi:hypothetical protein